MTTFTKEQLVERASAVKDRLEWALAAVPGRKDAEMDLHLAEIALASLEAELEVNTAMADIDMSDADCFTVARLHEIIYGSKLKRLEEKLLARFMHDVKQRRGATA